MLYLFLEIWQLLIILLFQGYHWFLSRNNLNFWFCDTVMQIGFPVNAAVWLATALYINPKIFQSVDLLAGTSKTYPLFICSNSVDIYESPSTPWNETGSYFRKITVRHFIVYIPWGLYSKRGHSFPSMQNINSESGNLLNNLPVNLWFSTGYWSCHANSSINRSFLYALFQ